MWAEKNNRAIKFFSARPLKPFEEHFRGMQKAQLSLLRILKIYFRYTILNNFIP